MKSLAVIPARGGSTRLKDKNIYPLGGKPLIRWTVEAVVESGVFDKIVVSTDSKKPTLLVVEGGRKNLSHWFWGIIPSEPHEEDRSGWIFDSWDALFNYLDTINEAEEDMPQPKSSRWVMLDVGSR